MTPSLETVEPDRQEERHAGGETGEQRKERLKLSNVGMNALHFQSGVI